MIKELVLEDTQGAFAYKSDKELKKTYIIFRLINHDLLNRLAVRCTPFLVNIRFPFVRSVLKATVFKQFIGAETLSGTQKVIGVLARYKVATILDYAAEGEDREESFDKAMQTFCETVAFAADKPDIPFISIKLSALGSLDFFSALNTLLSEEAVFSGAQPDMPVALQETCQRVMLRLEQVVQAAEKVQQPLMVDAEESWVQKAMDWMVYQMMRRYNKVQPLIYNTFQMYRSDKYEEMERYAALAAREGFIFALKVVRGAYMEKEAAFAGKARTLSPVHKDKKATDADFDASVTLGLQNPHIALVIATHNEQSIVKAAAEMAVQGIGPEDKRVIFAQLYGMGDHLTFNLAKAGYNVCKYLPFGRVEEAVPYLIRRAQENASFQGQSAQELLLLEKEMKRRKLL